MPTLAILSLLFSSTTAYRWVANQPGVDSSLLVSRSNIKRQSGSSCPFNADHKPAAPYTDQYPYTGAKNGLPGTGKGGIQVPAEGDEAHYFTPPGPNDIRGPCPGLNTAANHNFIAHDGIVTLTELLDAQQNVYNVGYDLALVLAVLGVAQDGDIVTEKLSIGCDATSRTSAIGLGREPGLNGHNKFESDASSTRNDYFLGNGDDYSFNGTLFAGMKGVADRISNGVFDREAMAATRSQRYDESLHTNPNFFFGPMQILLYGAASFLYELFPNYGNEGIADLQTISSFFGAQAKADAPGGWAHVPERIPEKWFSRRLPYTLADVVIEILALYLRYPKLFGGNIGTDNFNGLNTTFGIIKDGKLPDDVTAAQILCLLYQLGTMNVPSALSPVEELTEATLNWSIGKLNPVFKNAGCPLSPIEPK
ncbi:Cloroperoxidase [Periconia macrospinosa]|uniref:Cloroperoxidase n=1 Tax=Periconia macrospinosa TaxID=97972 RepID=A0A2V1DCC8_9PLEO|nr:Cloroperoxidase [Periconia macrospinosa]